MNVDKTGDGRYDEVKGTPDREPFSDDEMLELLASADKGIRELVELQKKVLGGFEAKKA